MIIGILKDNDKLEKRIPLTPPLVEKMVKMGAEILIEKSLGDTINIKDAAFTQSGAAIKDRPSILSTSDILLKVKKPALAELKKCKSSCIHISFLDPFNEKNLITELKDRNISAISLEMIPRTTIAQKMDALSSQANLAGYAAVIIAAERINKIFPMMMTPAGTISPARVFIIGAGVAGLQAIATAKRLGARVEAFDTRPVVEEQVKSLGAKFIKIDLGDTGQTKDGYAKALTPDQLEKQRQGMAKVCAQSDIVITTAQLFGRTAPRIITGDMIARMKPGSIIVDMAVESGGNVEGSKANEEIEINGVKILGIINLPGQVALDASQMLGNNLVNLMETFWDKENKTFTLDLSHDIIKNCLITHGGNIVNETILNFYNKKRSRNGA